MTEAIAGHLTSTCSETKEEHVHLVQQLLALCNTRACITHNMQRMQELCRIRNVDILQFEASIHTYSLKYDLTRKYVFEHLVKCWGISVEDIKDKYARSKNARIFLQNMKIADALPSFTNKSFQVHFDIKNKNHFLSKIAGAHDMIFLVDKIPITTANWVVNFELAFYDAEYNVLNEDEQFILKEFELHTQNSMIYLPPEFISFTKDIFDNQLRFQGHVLEIRNPPSYSDIHLFIVD